MFSKEMEALIEATLEDGVLTDQEKAVLVKRAQKEGIDIDELDVYIQSILQKRQKAEANVRKKLQAQEDQIAEEEARKSKMGDVKRCPQCGHVINGVEAVCPDCGYAFSNIEANACAKKLSEMLQAITDECYSKKYEKPQRKGRNWDDDDDDDDDEDDEEDKRANEIHEKQAKVIRSFPIPTTKADLFEFIALLWPNAKKGRFDDDTDVRYVGDWDQFVMLQDAYVDKYEECLNKIQILFPNDPMFSSFSEIKKEIKSEEESKSSGCLPVLFCFGAFISILYFVL